MAKDKYPSSKNPELRKTAETMLKALMMEKPIPETKEELLALVQELQIHQIELEMMNEELEDTRNELETSLELYRELYDFSPVAYLTLEEDSTIKRANLTAASFLGIEREKLPGSRFGLLISTDTRKIFNDSLENTFRNEQITVCSVSLIKNDKSILNVLINLLCDRSKLECRISLTDITRQIESESELKKYQVHLEELVKDRTAELTARNRELERYNELFVNREFRVKELKDELATLKAKKSL